MAKKNKKGQNNRRGLLNSGLGRAALVGGAAWATVRYFQNRAKNKALPQNNQAGPLDNNWKVAEDSPSQTGQWSGKPAESERHADLPKTDPDNMPGDTEVQSKTIWQRY